MVVAEHRALAERGAELVELRLDWLSKVPDLNRLVKDRPTPVIVTCRRQQDRGRWRGSEDQRLAILRSAIVAGVEYVDIEEDLGKVIPRYGDTKRIISHHNFEETPDDLEKIRDRMAQMDPDYIKLVTMANSPSDCVRMLKLVADSPVPMIGFCMGELGLSSRVLCGKYGSPITYATFSSDRELAPGQLSFEDMKSNYHYDRINSETQVFGVLGDPVAHSLSPLIHNSAFQEMGLNCVYVPFRVARHVLLDTLKEFEWLDVRGYSVTIPHKEEAIKKATLKDPSVIDIGAANTLYMDDGDNWNASNTDYLAALETIAAAFTDDPEDFRCLAGKRVLMLGAGGVARAIGMGITRNGGALTIASRTHKRATALAEQLGCKSILWENRGSEFADILVNCTPVGMHPNVDESPFEPQWLREGMLVFDTVYSPENTYLLKQARERDCMTATGIEMFIRQAAQQFNYFTGHDAPLEHMRETIRQAISAVKLN